MNEVKFGRILETGMGAIMSGTLNLTAMKLLGAPLALKSAVAINYFFPVMNWCIAITKNIQNKVAEYVIRIAIFSFIEILFNSVWCLINSGFISEWPRIFLPLLVVGTIAIFIALPIMTRVAKILASE